LLSLFNKKSKNLLGIDISSSSIKLLELSKQGDKYRVERYATRPLPPGAVVEKNIANVEAVGEEIEKLATLVKTKTTGAAVAVSGSSVIATNSVTTRVLVNNGDTVVLGGVFREEVTTSVTKTPILGDLPYIGNAFKRTEDSRSKTELLIFITPSVINELL
jgi:predicted NBD/HSP70 family sugar kinase